MKEIGRDMNVEDAKRKNAVGIMCVYFKVWCVRRQLVAGVAYIYTV